MDGERAPSACAIAHRTPTVRRWSTSSATKSAGASVNGWVRGPERHSMKDQYAGDIGDYSKFLLLDEVAKACAVSVGWYQTPDDGTTAGRLRDYLRPRTPRHRALQALHPTMHAELAQRFADGPAGGVADLERLSWV